MLHPFRELKKSEIAIFAVACLLIFVLIAGTLWHVSFLDQGGFHSQLLSPSPAVLFLISIVTLFSLGFVVYSTFVVAGIRRSAKRLSASEERYRGLFETGSDAVFTISPDGCFTTLNPAFEAITGWPVSDWIGKGYYSLVHPDDLPHVNRYFQRLTRGRRTPGFELRVVTRSGEQRIMDITASPQIAEDRVLMVSGIARDITERKKIEQSLQQSESRYRDLFENANDLIQSVGIDGSFQYVNAAWRKTLGYAEEEVKDLVLLDVIHPDSRLHCMSTFHRIMKGERIERLEAMFLTKEGTAVMVEGSINCSSIDGRPVATRGIFRNITGHRQAEEFIRNILETVDEGFIVIDRDFRITSSNKAFCRKLKISQEDICGKHCYEVSHHSTHPCYQAGEECPVKRTFETGQPQTGAHRHFDSCGEAVHIEIKSFPLKDSLGRIVSVIEIHNDITERKKLEEQLRHAQKMEAVGTLAGGVAHDFNNILTAIMGYASMMQMNVPETDSLRPMVEEILASTERGANLTRSLLSFSRRQVLSPKRVDMNDIVLHLEKLLARLIGEDIVVTVAVSAEPAVIKADPGQIEQVLINLATNARDAMPHGGRLSITTEIVMLDAHFLRLHGYGRAGRYVCLTAADTGIGMDRNTADRIFEPFFTTKEAGYGTGLGLSIVYGIVKQHQGYITVHSEPEQGTRFKVYLPAVRAGLVAQKSSETAMPRGGTATVLVAEDDHYVRTLTKAVLEGYGYSVIAAADGEDAVSKFHVHQNSIELLILDAIMPRKNGKDTYDAIRAVNPGIKALFMSGYAVDIIQKKGVLDDSLHFISKPVSPKELLQKVEEILSPREPDPAGNGNA